MNEIVNKFLLAGDKFMPELHLKQPGFTYSACGPFTRKKERIEKFIYKLQILFTEMGLIKLAFNMIVEVVLLLPNQIISLQMTFIGRLLENSRDENFIHSLETIFEVLI